MRLWIVTLCLLVGSVAHAGNEIRAVSFDDAGAVTRVHVRGARRRRSPSTSSRSRAGS